MTHAKNLLEKSDIEAVSRLIRDGYEAICSPTTTSMPFLTLVEALQTSPDALLPSENFRYILQYGIPRSGSTYIWQILESLFPGQVFKTHDYFSPLRPAVVTIRDLRDVIVSRWIRNKDASDAVAMTEPEIFSEIEKSRFDYEKYKKYVRSYEDQILVLKYEEFVQNPTYIVECLNRFFEYDYTVQILNACERFGLMNNKERSSRMSNFSEYDRNSMLHGKHINSGEIGNWKKYILPEHWDLLNENMKDPLIDLGYRI